MSMMICHNCDTIRDTDFETDCPTCLERGDLMMQDNPIFSETYDEVFKEWRELELEHRRVLGDRRINSMSDDFAYTNGSDERYRQRLLQIKRRRDACARSLDYLEALA